MALPSALLLFWMLQAPAVQAPPAASVSVRDWMVVVAAPVYLTDGGTRSEIVALPASGSGLVHLFSRKTLCAPATSGAAEPSDAAFGWRVASQIVARNETDIVVSVDWRRQWDAGRRVSSGPSGSVQLTLHAGDRIPLDHIANPTMSNDCRAVGLGLEVRLARPSTTSPSVASQIPIGATPGGARRVNAEFWLTHTSPSGTEHVLHHVMDLPEAGGRFAFAPTSVATSRGDVQVEMSGVIDRFRSPAGGEFFVISMNRLLTGASLPPGGISGSTGAVTSMPGPDEVLLLDVSGRGAGARGGGRGGGGAVGSGGQMRSGGGGGGGRSAAPAGAATPAQLTSLLEGHQFALRLRITEKE